MSMRKYFKTEAQMNRFIERLQKWTNCDVMFVQTGLIFIVDYKRGFRYV